MNFISTRKLLTGLCAIFLCTSGGALFGTEAVPFPEVIPVEQEVPAASIEENLIDAIGYNPDDAYLYRIHNDAYYHLFAYSALGDVVQLHDDSKWSVHPSQWYTVLGWVQSDDIFIKPRSSCFSSYRYVLHNRTLQQSVEVNLINPPLSMGSATFYIVNIEPYLRLVQLSDNTVWQIDHRDWNFYEWRIGQRVLVGVDNYWRTATLPHILINVDMYKEPYSSANFYGYGINY